MRILAGFVLAFLVLAQASATTPAEVLGFQAWKKERTDEARVALDKVTPAPTPAPLKKPALPPKPRADLKYQLQAQLNLEIAQELSVNDYFVLYLAQFKTRDLFIEAAKKLTPEELADLMMAYQKHLVGAQELDVLTSATLAR